MSKIVGGAAGALAANFIEKKLKGNHHGGHTQSSGGGLLSGLLGDKFKPHQQQSGGYPAPAQGYPQQYPGGGSGHSGHHGHHGHGHHGHGHQGHGGW